MTIEPEPTTRSQFRADPKQCALHANALHEIKVIVIDTRKEVIEMKAMGGPIAIVDKKADSAHFRIDAIETGVKETKLEVKTIKKEQKAIIARVGVILAPVAAAIGGAIGAIVAFLVNSP